LRSFCKCFLLCLTVAQHQVDITSPSPSLPRSEDGDHESKPSPERDGVAIGDYSHEDESPTATQSFPGMSNLGDALRSPGGYSDGMSDISTQAAINLISRGTVTFRGECREIPLARNRHLYFATAENEDRELLDEPQPAPGDDFEDISLSLVGDIDGLQPWEVLEQPAMSFCFGVGPGTVTLNHWVSLSGCLQASARIESDVRPRKIKLLAILERLTELEDGLQQVNTQLVFISNPSRT
jgi:hypothetical protein